jgi:guanylate kinase
MKTNTQPSRRVFNDKLLSKLNFRRLAKRKEPRRALRREGAGMWRENDGRWARRAEPRILTVLQAKFRKGKQLVVKPGLLIFVSGPSGVGKSTVCRQLAVELPGEIGLSATTRAEKPQDKFGKPYRFVDEKTFQSLLEAGEFLEYAFKFGNWYGTLREPVERALAEGRTIVLDIEIQGAIQIHKLFPRAMGVFILPPSLEDLKARLENRKRDDAATIHRRLAEAQQEIRSAEASGVFDLMVVNEDNGVEKTVNTVKRAANKFREDPTLF